MVPEEADKYKFDEVIKGNPDEAVEKLGQTWKTWNVDYNEIRIGLWNINKEEDGVFKDQIAGGPWK